MSEKTKNILIIGTGANASVISQSLIETFNNGDIKYKFCGYIEDKTLSINFDNKNQFITGSITDIQRFIDEDYYFINATEVNSDLRQRMSLIESLNIPVERWVSFIHPLSYIAPNLDMGYGCVVMPYAISQPGTKLGNFCTIMFGAIMGHDNNVGDHCFFDSGSISGAYLTIGNGVYVGINSTIREFLKIGNYSRIGIGSILLKEVADEEVWVGNPAKFYKKS
ncbi:MAG: hypothetical protein LBQ22_07910 [Bacteroidales bacterium]|jgi:acetyltransferase EpsM|nr:hypothetical protein [Bacteroidales bacterium]